MVPNSIFSSFTSFFYVHMMQSQRVPKPRHGIISWYHSLVVFKLSSWSPRWLKILGNMNQNRPLTRTYTLLHIAYVQNSIIFSALSFSTIIDHHFTSTLCILFISSLFTVLVVTSGINVHWCRNSSSRTIEFVYIWIG